MLAASLEPDIGPEPLSRGCYLANKVSFTRLCRHVHGICAFSIPCALNIVFDAARRKPFLLLPPPTFLLLLPRRPSPSNLIHSSSSPLPTKFQQPPRVGQKNYFDLISRINLSARGRTLFLLLALPPLDWFFWISLLLSLSFFFSRFDSIRSFRNGICSHVAR